MLLQKYVCMSVSQYQVIKTNTLRMISGRKLFINISCCELELTSLFLGKDKCDVLNEVHFEARKHGVHIQILLSQVGRFLKPVSE